MLRAGFQKAYVDEAVVYHFHAIDPGTHHKAATTEGRFWGRYFGYDLHPDPKDAAAVMDARDRAYAIRAGADMTAVKDRQLLDQATANGRAAGYGASRA